MNSLFVKRNSKKVIICNKVIFRNNIFRKGFGLMFHKKIYDEAHIFLFKEKKKIALTMWFVFFPIDVLYLDEKKRIVEIVENFLPFTNYYPKKESMFVVELPAGKIKEQKLKIEEEIFF